jgi:hypothetical protein
VYTHIPLPAHRARATRRSTSGRPGSPPPSLSVLPAHSPTRHGVDDSSGRPGWGAHRVRLREPDGGRGGARHPQARPVRRPGDPPQLVSAHPLPPSLASPRRAGFY